MSASFSSLLKTCVVAGVPEALGSSSVRFETLTVIGLNAEGVSNAGIVFVRPFGSVSDIGTPDPNTPPGSITHAGFEVRPRNTVTIPIPAGVISSADLWEVVADVAGDGVLAYYSGSNADYVGELETKLETAISRLIQSIAPSLAGADVRTGHSDDEITRNLIICQVTGGTEAVLNTGLYDMECVVTVKTHANQMDDDRNRVSLDWHRRRTAYVRDLFQDVNTPQVIAGFVRHLGCVRDSIRNRRFTSEIDGKFYSSQISFTITAAGDAII